MNDINSGSYELGALRAISKKSVQETLTKMRNSLDFGTQHTHRADQDAADIGKNVLAAMHYFKS